MILYRVGLLALLCLMLAAIMAQWHLSLGFDPLDTRWWVWLARAAVRPGALPDSVVDAVYTAGAGFALAAIVLGMVAMRAANRTISGARSRDQLHGSARWATGRDVRKAQLLQGDGVVVGGWQGAGGIKMLRDAGPAHVMCFAPTGTGKGVSLIVPTLLNWTGSTVVLDIKGENFALTSGWRSSQGQRVLRFEPTDPENTARFNPLAEVRIGTGRDIADCQNIAAMIIDPDGRGLKDYWMKEGWAWLSVMLLHVIYRIRNTEGRRASLADVNLFASGIVKSDDDTDMFDRLLADMVTFGHGAAYIDDEIRRGATRMQLKAGPERSGVHSSAVTELALYADPIVAKNTATSDFTIDEMVNAEQPLSLYMVIRPSDMDRLRPLVRIVMNLLVRRLTEGMRFEDGRSSSGNRHRLLLMLDEFTSIGKLEIFESALAFMRGYGLRAYVIVQDTVQLQKHYGREEAITSNCGIRIAFAPNRIETARLLSDMTGKTTIVQSKRSRSRTAGRAGSVSDSLQETGRALLTADECMNLDALRTEGGKVKPGEVLIFAPGVPPIRGRQHLYFQDRELKARAAMGAPERQAPDGQ